MIDLPIDIQVCPELGEAGELGGTIHAGGLIARTNDQPIAVSLRSIFSQLGTCPEEASLSSEQLCALYGRFDLWLVPHTVHIIRRHGHAEPTCVGIDIRYVVKGDSTCSVRALIPAPQHITHGQASGIIGLNGELGTAPHACDQESPVGKLAGIAFRGTIGARLVLRFHATVVTPYVSAIGQNSSRCEWRFDKHKEPLFGRDITTYAVVALPRRKRTLEYESRFYFESRAAFLSHRYESDWTRVSCRLTHSAAEHFQQ